MPGRTNTRLCLASAIWPQVGDGYGIGNCPLNLGTGRLGYLEAAGMRRYELTDEQWELIKDFFPPLVTNGRPWRDHRTMVNAMLWILNTGSPWHDLPERYGPWQTAYNRFNRWRKDGTFDASLRTGADSGGGKIMGTGPESSLLKDRCAALRHD